MNVKREKNRWMILLSLICVIVLTASARLVQAESIKLDTPSIQINTKAGYHSLTIEIEAYFQLLDKENRPVAYTPVVMTMLGYKYRELGDTNDILTKEVEAITNSQGYVSIVTTETFTTKDTIGSLPQIVFFMSFPEKYGVLQAQVIDLAPNSLDYGNYTYYQSNGGENYFEAMDNPTFWGYDHYGFDVNRAIYDFMDGRPYNEAYDHIMLGSLYYRSTTSALGKLLIGNQTSKDPVIIKLMDYEHLTTITETYEKFDEMDGNQEPLADSNSYSFSALNEVGLLEVYTEISHDELGIYSLYGYSEQGDRESIIPHETSDLEIYVSDLPIDLSLYYGRKIQVVLKYNEQTDLEFESINRWSHEDFDYDQVPLSSDGRQFMGWNTASDGSGYDVTSDDVMRELLEAGNELILYAQWESNIYTISFNNNGGVGVMESFSVVEDVETLLPRNSFTKEGYSFIGWNTKADETGISFSDQATVTNLVESGEIVTLYAQWVANQYTVNFNANGGIGIMSSQLIDFDSQVTLAENSFTKQGYHFTGWNTQANGEGVSFADLEEVVNLSSEQDGSVILYAQWAPNRYTVNFDANGGNGIMSSQLVDFDSLANLSENDFTKQGYHFAGWNTQMGGGGVSYTDTEEIVNLSTEQNGSITLYAQWQANQYILNFHGNSGLGNMTSQVMIYDELTVISENTFYKTGFHFTNWNSSAYLDGEIYEDRALVMNLVESGEIDLYAQWELNKYTIHFDGNSGLGTTESQEVWFGSYESLTENNFTRHGYHFIGWNTEIDGGGTTYVDQEDVANLTTVHNGSVTLYAQWEANQYFVNYEANGGEGTMTSQTLNYDDSLTLESNSFTRLGYNFMGWNTEMNGGGTSYSNQEEVLNLSSEQDGLVTLYAQWTANQYTVNFEANGGDGNMSNLLVDFDSYVILTENSFTKLGYHFTSWNTQANGGGVSYTDLEEIINLCSEENDSVTFYAQWVANQYTVNFDANGGVGIMSGQLVDFDNSVILISNNFSKLGYRFTGWNTEANGIGISYSDQEEVLNLSSEQDGLVTLYAQWTANQYTVNFDANGGDGIMLDLLVDFDSCVILTENSFTKQGYHFIGWNTETYGGGTSYIDQEEVSNISSEQDGLVTLYAQWTANQYTVNFDANGGVGSMISQSLYYDDFTILELNSFTRIGHYFTGWNTEANGTGISYTDQELIMNLNSDFEGKIVLYAQWNKEKLINLPETGVNANRNAREISMVLIGTGLLILIFIRRHKEHKKAV